MTAPELMAFMSEHFPQAKDDFVVEGVAPMEVTVRMPVSERNLRPGGTVSGPSIFSLADVSVYFAILAMIGPVELAVTTNATIDFMRKPSANTDLLAVCRLLKLGRVLAVGDCLIYSGDLSKPVARASMTYSIPPR